MRRFLTTSDWPALVLAFLTCGSAAACTTRTGAGLEARAPSVELTAAEADVLARELTASAAAFLRGYKEVGGRAGVGPIRLHVDEHQLLGARGSVLLQIQGQLVREGLVVTGWARRAEGLQAELELRVKVDRAERADGRSRLVLYVVELALVDTASGSVEFVSSAQLDKQFYKGWFGR